MNLYIGKLKPLSVRCILFDLDGTLFDTADSIRKAVKETKDAFNLDINVDQAISESLNVLEGRKSRLNFLILGFHFGFISFRHPLQIFRIKKYFDERFSLYTRESTLLPHVKEALEHLKSLRLAIVTARDKEWTDTSLASHKIAHYFEVVVTTDDVRKNKPHPGSLVKALTILKVEPEECLYVGDLPSDIIAGKRAGVKTAAVLTGLSSRERLEKENPDFVFKNLEELASHFAKR